jgi:peptidoglycan/xylan/chitin deacetylase (PgdA/CDA1 family)
VNRFLFTIDVEDWFQVENLRPWNPPAAWDSRELRVEANVHALLDLFDGKVRATFFVLGWLAERLPHLVREIAARGHEVASHGSSHRMCRPLSDADLGDELQGSKRLIEDITGAEVAGFRAPNFSVDDRVLSLAREAGYRYDSSLNSFSPWEIDPEQPRVGQASPVARFKHYTNLDKTMGKLRGMLEAFTGCRFVGCGEYIGEGARHSIKKK